MLQSGFLHQPDGQIFYQSGDNIAGLPVIFLHGFPFTGIFWQDIATNLDTQFRPIILDLRNHGMTVNQSNIYSIDDVVDDIIQLMNFLDIQTSIFCGMSMGGYILMRLIERYPNRVKGIIFSNTKSISDSNDAKTSRFRQIKLLQSNHLEQFIGEVIPSLFHPNTLGTRKDIIHHVEKMIRSNQEEKMRGSLMMLASRPDATNTLKEITVPTLYLASEMDAISPKEEMFEMQKSTPNSTFKVISNAGHLATIENREEWLSTFQLFLFENFLN